VVAGPRRAAGGNGSRAPRSGTLAAQAGRKRPVAGREWRGHGGAAAPALWTAVDLAEAAAGFPAGPPGGAASIGREEPRERPGIL